MQMMTSPGDLPFGVDFDFFAGIGSATAAAFAEWPTLFAALFERFDDSVDMGLW